MKFFRFFKTAGAVAAVEGDTAKLGKRLAESMKTLLNTTNDLDIGAFKRIGKITTYNDIDVNVLVKGLKRGDPYYIGKMFNTETVPPILRDHILKDAKSLPDYHIGQLDDFSKKFKGKMSEKDLKLLSSVSDESSGVMSAVTKNSTFRNLYESVKGRSIISKTGKVIAVATSLTAFFVIVRRHQLNTTGCFVTSYNEAQKKLKLCRLHNLSCDGSKTLSNGAEGCEDSFYDLLPEDMRGNKCAASTVTGWHCVNCPSEMFTETQDELVKQFNNEEFDKVSKVDRFLVECRQPSFLDALIDIVETLGDTALNAIKSVPNTIKNLIKYALIIGGIIGGFVLLFVLYKIASLFFNSNKYSNSERENGTSQGKQKTQIK